MSETLEEREARVAAWQKAKDEAYADPNRRKARCSCGKEVPSHAGLPFLHTAERHAVGRCGLCGYAEVAHSPEVRARPHLKRSMGDGHEFTQAEPREFDTFYCGCRGWD